MSPNAFAFSGVLAAGGASNYSIVQIHLPPGSDAELWITYLLNPSASTSAILRSSSNLILSGEVPLVGITEFLEPGYTRKAVITKGYTTVAAPADAFSFGFDLPIQEPLVLRAGQYVAFQRTTINATLSAGVICRETDPTPGY